MQKKFSVLEISAFELVAVNSPDSNENSSKRQSLCFLLLFSLESGEFTATSSNADISKTENFFSVFYCFNEIYVKFRVF